MPSQPLAIEMAGLTLHARFARMPALPLQEAQQRRKRKKKRSRNAAEHTLKVVNRLRLVKRVQAPPGNAELFLLARLLRSFPLLQAICIVPRCSHFFP